MKQSGWSRVRSGACTGLVLAALATTAPLLADSQQAEIMPLAVGRSLMLDIDEGDQRAIMVGERGHILVSESRSDWRQIVGVPTRATLTAVATRGDQAWAVGHDGVILHSADGGLSWTLQRSDPWTPPAEGEFDRDPRLGAPLLDVIFLDDSTGIAIGAYSLLLRTTDSGATWNRIALNGGSAQASEAEPADDAATGDGEEDWMFSEDELTLDEEVDPHLNGIVRTPGGTLFIVAERGSAYRSRDNGLSWERLSLPYDGSMFGVIALGDRHLLAYGLRGHVQESRDDGDTWTEVETGTQLSLLGGAPLEDGGAVLVGANGIVLHRPDAEADFVQSTFENSNLETPVLAAVQAQGSKTFLVAGEKGFGRYQVN